MGANLNMFSFPYCRKHNLATITIGNDVTIYNRLVENLAGISHATVLAAVMPGARLIIGNHVGMSGVILFSCCEIIIEDYVNLGVGVLVYDTDHHPVDYMARRIHDISRINTRPVRICKDAFIGAHVIVLKGVTIGERSIVAAGSIVTRDIPSDCIAAGSPAKVVKMIG